MHFQKIQPHYKAKIEKTILNNVWILKCFLKKSKLSFILQLTIHWNIISFVGDDIEVEVFQRPGKFARLLSRIAEKMFVQIGSWKFYVTFSLTYIRVMY